MAYPQIQPDPPRVYTPPATTNPPAPNQDADKKGEQKPKEEKETIRILHLHGDLGKLTLVPTDGKKPHTVGKLQLRACSAKAEQAELIQCIIQSDASSKGLLWTVTPVGSQNVLLHNGEPMPQQVPFALLGGHRLSIAPAQTPRIPFLTLIAQFETAVKTVSHNR